MVKNWPAMQEIWIRPLGWEDHLEKGLATYASILARRIPRTEEPGGLQSRGRTETGMTEQLTLSLFSLYCGPTIYPTSLSLLSASCIS